MIQVEERMLKNLVDAKDALRALLAAVTAMGPQMAELPATPESVALVEATHAAEAVFAGDAPAGISQAASSRFDADNRRA